MAIPTPELERHFGAGSDGNGDGMVVALEGEDALDVWPESVLRVLQLWV